MPDPLILAEREGSGMTSVWNEYLCLKKGDAKTYCLFTGRYSALGAASQFYDDDIGDYDIPDEIDGVAVHGIEDVWVGGGELECTEWSESVEFGALDDSTLAGWLQESGWAKQFDVATLQRLCAQIL